MHRSDPWERHWHSIPIGAMPNEPIGLQSAVRLITERMSCIADARDRSPPISGGAEFMNMWYGGNKLKTDMEERAELARAEEIHTAARDWLTEYLRTNNLFRDGGAGNWWV